MVDNQVALAQKILKALNNKEAAVASIGESAFLTDIINLCRGVLGKDKQRPAVVSGEWFYFQKSRNLKRCKYDPSLELLTIQFQSGAVWTYVGVSAGVARDLVQAESAGKFFNDRIKGSYEAKAILVDAEDDDDEEDDEAGD